MLKQIKALGLSIILGASLLVTGCSNKDELTATLTNMETDYYAINDEMSASDTFDKVAINEAIEDLKAIQEQIKTEQANYEKDETEYKMFDAFDKHIEYKIEGCNILIDMTENLMTTALMQDEIKTQIETYATKMDEAWNDYEAYKEELEIVTNPIKSTATEETLDEVNKEEKEEQKSEDTEELVVCAHCEKSFKQSEIQRVGENNICNKCYEVSLNGSKVEQEIGQCYDCGEYKPVDQMTFNGRSYHCGCLVGNCEACGTSVFKGQDKYSNGFLLCSACYQQEQDEMKQYEAEPNNQILYGTDEENYTCPDCGYTGPFGTMCDCE